MAVRGAVRLFHVCKTFPPDQRALDDVSLSVAPGAFVVLSGPSGAGKTTLLRLLYGAEMPTAGQVLVNGRNVSQLTRRTRAAFRRGIGIVFQDFRLLAYLSALDNVALAGEAAGLAKREARRRAFLLLRRLGLKDEAARPPRLLSAGEQQRVAVARALVNEPPLLVADEPTGNLDHATGSHLMDIFEEINAGGTTVVIASHNEDVRGRAREVVWLAAGRQVGPQ